MNWTAALSMSELQKNNRLTLMMEGKKVLFIFHDEKVYAIQSQCPHMKFPLTKGKINEKCEITCPLHKSAFDLKTGDVQCWSPWPPAVGALLGKLSKPKKLQTYPTRVEKDQIYINLGD